MLAKLLFLAGVQAVELSASNFEEKTAGKTVFIKFLAPWCGHCKSMKPDWDKLMKQFAKHPTTLIGDVDCTAGGESLCQEVGVRGYPTIKYGDPANLEDYEGGRDFAALKKFADGLKPSCGPTQVELCDADQKAKILELQALSAADLDAKISTKEEEGKAAEKEFESAVEKLQAEYEGLSKKKDATLADIKASGLGLMKAVKAAAKSKGEL